MRSPGPSPQIQRKRQPGCGSRAGPSGHDLMDALSTESVPAGDLRHGLTTPSSRQDLRIPLKLPVRTASKRTPFPFRGHLKGTDALRRQFVLPVTATCVVDPVPKSNWVELVHLDVSCRDFAMALAQTELIEGSDVLDEGIFMVHAKQFSHNQPPSPLRCQAGFKALPPKAIS